MYIANKWVAAGEEGRTVNRDWSDKHHGWFSRSKILLVVVLVFYRPHNYPNKIYTNKNQESMLNISVVSFYDNFGLFFKGSEDMASDGIEKSTTFHNRTIY